MLHTLTRAVKSSQESRYRLQFLRRILKVHRGAVTCGGILLLMAVNLACINSTKTITNDEVVHIPAGYHYLIGGDFRQNPEHPPLVKMWAALPLLLLHPHAGAFHRPADFDYARFTIDSSLDFWRANQPQFRTISFLARAPMILLTLSLGVLIFNFGRDFFGERAALFAVGLFSLEPTMLAHGRIVHTDIPAALGYLLFFFTSYRFLKLPTRTRGPWFGLATGFALLTKFSLVVLIPIFLLVLTYSVWRASTLRVTRSTMIARAGAAILCCLLLINAAYYFQHPRLAAAEAHWITNTSPANSERVKSTVKALSVALPTYYVFGVLTILSHNEVGHESSLLGKYGNRGWWYYFPVAFALKTTIPFLLLVIFSLFWALAGVIMRRDRRLIWFVFPVTLYLGLAMMSSLNIGIRHIAPIFPFLFLLGGAFIDRLIRFNRKTGIVIAVFLFSWMVADCVRTYPDYMSFTTPLLGNRPGWEVLSDSNVEWGEDVGALAEYLKARGETKIVGALSGGWATMELYGVRMIDYAPATLESAPTRYVAIGASHLNGSTCPGGLKDENGNELTGEKRYNYLVAYRLQVPEAVFGKTIYLYRQKD